MKERIKKSGLICMMLLFACLLSGCMLSRSADELMALPQLPIVYTDLSQQIEQLLGEGYEYAAPTGGRNIQAVQMVDLDGDGEEEALAFFRRSGEEKPLKIVVFRPSEDGYEPLCTIESSGTGIDSIYYRDLTDDGNLELVVGWRISTTVQTMAVYSLAETPQVLMRSGYTRYSIQDLDGDGVPSLLLLRADGDGVSVAEFYSWQDDAMTVSYRCPLSVTMAELSRGSVVSGNLSGGEKALYITGVTDSGTAVTDLLAWQEDTGLVNTVMDPATGLSTASYGYRQLAPQDINGDGIIEIPTPGQLYGSNEQNGGMVRWMQYDIAGQSRKVMTTYHCRSAGWYYVVNDELDGRMSVSTGETASGENQVVLQAWGKDVLAIYTITGDNREQRAARGSRVVLGRQTGTVYAGELLDAAQEFGTDESTMRRSFNLIVGSWAADDNWNG